MLTQIMLTPYVKDTSPADVTPIIKAAMEGSSTQDGDAQAGTKSDVDVSDEELAVVLKVKLVTFVCP